MRPATDTWPHAETNPQRQALLAAADRLLAGAPRHASGRLSVVQLAIEADVKYWVVAQKHTDLRDHFQRLTTAARNTPATRNSAPDAHDELVADHAALKKHCAGLEQLITLYATAVNELALENQVFREHQATSSTTVTSFRRRANRTD